MIVHNSEAMVGQTEMETYENMKPEKYSIYHNSIEKSIA